MDALLFIKDVVDLTTNEFDVCMRMWNDTLKDMRNGIDLERVEVTTERLFECSSRIAMARAILIESDATEEEPALSRRAISLFDSLIQAIESSQHHLVLLLPRGD